MPTRDQSNSTFLGSFGTPAPLIQPSPLNEDLGRAVVVSPNIAASLQTASHNMSMYAAMNASIWKGRFQHPANQGQRAALMQREVMMIDPRDNPSRSEKSEGYTDPAQVFVSTNTWQTPSGQSSKGERLRQPSTKAVSPFSSVPIPTRMPWDL